MKFFSHFSNFSEDLAAALLEFIGTAFFLLLGLGGIQAASAENLTSGQASSDIQLVLYISTSMGLSLLVSAWLFFRITGGLFNPNVSLALLLVGVIKPVRCILYCVAQLLGAIAGSAILLALTSKNLTVKWVSSWYLPPHTHHSTYQHLSSTGDQCYTRRFHRNVHHGGSCPIGTHARCRKTSSHALRSCAYHIP